MGVTANKTPPHVFRCTSAILFSTHLSIQDVGIGVNPSAYSNVIRLLATKKQVRGDCGNMDSVSIEVHDWYFEIHPEN
jgi:hypothetical protein